ncbi:hypothetical protein FisN_34Lh006 [Fistulifera solaris]|uniref:Uncharacterized protein n=1 Tax=Fistulifera solaris TaxID=1519565 RepID=A0A1Z5JHC2_FISSO|nr:hypothetical protein FisN_34Lh006 [Fistulifera solaris]|eukprot:GAX13407.1 hypothetical protein FisN_34Lh006 [Fistulifera solaris]
MAGVEEDLLRYLIEQLTHFARAAGFSIEEAIDVEQCRTILEVTDGDIDIASQLYWDDYMARRNRDQNHEPEEDVAPRDEMMNDDEVRRRLEPDFNDQIEEIDDDAELAEGVRIRLREDIQETNRLARAARDLAERAGENEDDGNNVIVGRLAARAAELLANRAHLENESVSVSDDECGGVWKVVGGIAASLKHRGNEEEEEEGLPARKRRKTEEKETSIDEDGFLSDSDWVWDSFDSRKQIPLCDPFELLWGSPSTRPADSAPRPGRVQPEPDPEPAVEVAGNVIDDDDVDEPLNNKCCGIPRSWLNAGFSLSEDGMGLVLPPPTEDDITYFGWQQQADGTVQDSPPPPYHCGSVSALLSIVTGLLYTGVSYQRLSISASSARVSFAELSEEDKKREFESRLADVLAVLLQIAAKASLARKEKALATLRKSKDPTDIRRWQKIERKLRLCPTCWWETDGSGELRLPVGRESDKLQIATSYTNIEELRSYVLSNMRSFTARGGCALFLETITRIHGKGVILRLIQEARRQSGCFSSIKSLIQCNCDDANRHVKIPPQQLRVRSKTKELMEALPKSAKCMSIELISLLLTGRVHSTLKGWSTGVLGLGMLSYTSNEIGKSLTRPGKPVWILQGPSSYSVIWMSSGHEHGEVFAKADQPDSVVELTHFCCWPGQQNTSLLRLSAGCYQRRDKESLKFSLSDTESVDENLCVSEYELVAAHVNEDDRKLYKENHRLWRYRFDDGWKGDDCEASWIPFYRLSERQKLIVETKLGPKINTILLKRWPRAAIEKVDDNSPNAIV